MAKQITLISPLDMHLHFREGEMLKLVAPYSSSYFAGGVIMPNLIPPVTTAQRLASYQESIIKAIRNDNFIPYMTLFFQRYSRDFLTGIRDSILGIKLYPDGVTTNSNSGVQSLSDYEEVFAVMEELDIPLMVHGESQGFVMDREHEFLVQYDYLAQKFRKLRIIMEHITTKQAVDLLQQHDNLYATITLQHLLYSLNDLLGGKLQPHLFCKPILKRVEDQEALLDIALQGHHKVMLGSDSAPHPITEKEAAYCAAGVFSAPVLLPKITQIFDEQGASVEALQRFVSDNAQSIYRIQPPIKKVILVNEPFLVSEVINKSSLSVVPFLAGEEIPWRVAETITV